MERQMKDGKDYFSSLLKTGGERTNSQDSLTHPVDMNLPVQRTAQTTDLHFHNFEKQNKKLRPPHSYFVNVVSYLKWQLRALFHHSAFYQATLKFF